jgi:hypothetical protein
MKILRKDETGIIVQEEQDVSLTELIKERDALVLALNRQQEEYTALITELESKIASARELGIKTDAELEAQNTPLTPEEQIQNALTLVPEDPQTPQPESIINSEVPDNAQI